MNKLIKKARHGFTLVEIMIVVLIIGILLAIAVPNFIKARETSRSKACQANLKQIDSAKEQYAMDFRLGNASAISGGWSDLVGSDKYIKATPLCPSNGTYTIANVGTDPTCAYSATNTAHALNP